MNIVIQHHRFHYNTSNHLHRKTIISNHGVHQFCMVLVLISMFRALTHNRVGTYIMLNQMTATESNPREVSSGSPAKVTERDCREKEAFNSDRYLLIFGKIPP